MSDGRGEDAETRRALKVHLLAMVRRLKAEMSHLQTVAGRGPLGPIGVRMPDVLAECNARSDRIVWEQRKDDDAR